jgi:hypothetical protein
LHLDLRVRSDEPSSGITKERSTLRSTIESTSTSPSSSKSWVDVDVKGKIRDDDRGCVARP